MENLEELMDEATKIANLIKPEVEFRNRTIKQSEHSVIGITANGRSGVIFMTEGLYIERPNVSFKHGEYNLYCFRESDLEWLTRDELKGIVKHTDSITLYMDT